MARPIKETPILYGKESDKFLKTIKQNEKDASRKVSTEEYNYSKKLYDEVMKNAKR